MLKIKISVYEYTSNSMYVMMAEWLREPADIMMDSELMRYRVDGPAQTIYQLQQNQVTHLLFWKNVLVSNNLIK